MNTIGLRLQTASSEFPADSQRVAARPAGAGRLARAWGVDRRPGGDRPLCVSRARDQRRHPRRHQPAGHRAPRRRAAARARCRTTATAAAARRAEDHDRTTSPGAGSCWSRRWRGLERGAQRGRHDSVVRARHHAASRLTARGGGPAVRRVHRRPGRWQPRRRRAGRRRARRRHDARDGRRGRLLGVGVPRAAGDGPVRGALLQPARRGAVLRARDDRHRRRVGGAARRGRCCSTPARARCASRPRPPPG